jgi:hypothetical protein
MTGTGWYDDDRLLADLRAATQRAGAPTETMRAAGAAAFSWGTVDAELAALAYDSLLDDSVLVRSAAAPPRTLVFEGTGLSVEIELTADTLAGQIVPPGAGEVVLLAPHGELARTSTDELGLFRLARADRGPFRLRCVTPSGVLLTEWTTL